MLGVGCDSKMDCPGWSLSDSMIEWCWVHDRVHSGVLVGPSGHVGWPINLPCGHVTGGGNEWACHVLPAPQTLSMQKHTATLAMCWDRRETYTVLSRAAGKHWS